MNIDENLAFIDIAEASAKNFHTFGLKNCKNMKNPIYFEKCGLINFCEGSVFGPKIGLGSALVQYTKGATKVFCSKRTVH